MFYLLEETILNHLVQFCVIYSFIHCWLNAKSIGLEVSNYMSLMKHLSKNHSSSVFALFSFNHETGVLCIEWLAKCVLEVMYSI